MSRPLGVITGASSGIGEALARVMVDEGFDLIVCAAAPRIDEVARTLATAGASVEAVRADLSSHDGVELLVERVIAAGVPLDALAINAGVGVGERFIDRPLEEHLEVMNLNVVGAVHLAHRLVSRMVIAGAGRVLFTSSIAATTPGPFQSTYAASKAFIQSFSQALRSELADTGVTVTALMPGATDTEFFERAGLEDTKVGQISKDDPSEVARQGFDAMMAGKDHVVAGRLANRLQASAATHIPERAAAALHSAMSRPGSGT